MFIFLFNLKILSAWCILVSCGETVWELKIVLEVHETCCDLSSVGVWADDALTLSL